MVERLNLIGDFRNGVLTRREINLELFAGLEAGEYRAKVDHMELLARRKASTIALWKPGSIAWSDSMEQPAREFSEHRGRTETEAIILSRLLSSTLVWSGSR